MEKREKEAKPLEIDSLQFNMLVIWQTSPTKKAFYHIEKSPVKQNKRIIGEVEKLEKRMQV